MTKSVSVSKESRVPSHCMKLKRESASVVLSVVDKYGAIKPDTLVELGSLLDKMDRDYHVEVAVHPSKDSSLLKTIDNENDAQITIQNIKQHLSLKETC